MMSRRKRYSPKKVSKKIRLLFFFFLLVFGSGSGFFLSGKILTVHDGDTVTVFSVKEGSRKIRLYGIDCPETNQPGGLQATEYMNSLALFREVDILTIDRDQYGREVAILKLKDGRSLNEEMLSAGQAWVYSRYCSLPQCVVWKKKEVDARRAGLGLWQDRRPIPPWQWRKSR